MLDVVALGELLIDFAAKSKDPDGYPTMAANPGGAPGNFLAALNVYARRPPFSERSGMTHSGICFSERCKEPESRQRA